MRNAICSTWIVLLALVGAAPSIAGGPCIDGDGDGYGRFGDASCPQGAAVDCDDTTPQCTTSCADGDGDGLPDCNDLCPSAPVLNDVVRLNEDLVPGGNVLALDSTSDDRWAVYVADQDADGRYDLYSVSADGGAPIQLATHLYSPSYHQISPDGTRVSYARNSIPSGETGIFSVPVQGGPSVELFPGAISHEFTPDGSKVIVRSIAGNDWALYWVPATGGTPVQFTDPLVDGNVEWLWAFPDSDHVIFSSSLNGTTRLINAELDGPSRIVMAEGFISSVGFSMTPDGSRAYWTHGDEPEFLKSAAVDGSGVTIVDTADYIRHLDVTPVPVNGEYRLVYFADRKLISVPVSGGPKTILDTFSFNSVSIFGLTPDGLRVVYRVPTQTSIRSVDVLGAESPTTLSPTTGVADKVLAPDGLGYRGFGGRVWLGSIFMRRGGTRVRPPRDLNTQVVNTKRATPITTGIRIPPIGTSTSFGSS